MINKCPLVLIVIPNKDGVEHLRNSLNSIFYSNYQNFHVVVVDNCSKDDSIKYVKNAHPKCRIIQNKKDLGFSGSVNKGLLYGLNIDADFIVVFSNDVVIYPQWLANAVDSFYTQEEYKILGFKELNGIGCDSLLKTPVTIESKQQSKPDCVSIYMIKSSLINNVGFFDESYYMYGEDDDFFYRCRQSGIFTQQTNIPIWHKGEGFSSSIIRQKLMSQYVYRNMLRMSVKNHSAVKVFFTLIKMIAFAALPNFIWKNKGVNPSVNRLVRFNWFIRMRYLIYSIFWNIVNIRNTKKSALMEREWIKKHQY